MHEIHKLSVDVALTHMIANKGITKYGERAVSEMYKEYKKMADMKVMGALDPRILTRPPKREH